MLRHARVFCVLWIALAAGPADGAGTSSTLRPTEQAQTEARDAAKVVPPTEAVVPVLDRTTQMSEAFTSTAYTVAAPLEYEACSGLDQRRKLTGRIPSSLIRAASEQLLLPMGSGKYLSVRGQRYLFCLERHYREPGTGPGPTGWHKGVTIYRTS